MCYCLVARGAYLGTLKRTELLAKMYVAKRFGEKCDFSCVLLCSITARRSGVVLLIVFVKRKAGVRITMKWNK